jgi:hypothetical protein
MGCGADLESLPSGMVVAIIIRSRTICETLPKENGMKTTSLVTRVVLLVVIVTAGLMTSEVMAQSPGRTGNLAPTVQAWRPYGAKKSRTPSSTPQVRSESTAKALSLWSTVIPITAGMVLGNNDHTPVGGALILTGIIVGPSTGYFYGNCAGRGAQGILIRIATGGVTVALTFAVANSYDPDESFSEFAAGTMAIGVAGLGTAVIMYEAIHDISQVKSEVRKHNAGISSMSLSVAPKFFAQSKAFGLELRAIL